MPRTRRGIAISMTTRRRRDHIASVVSGELPPNLCRPLAAPQIDSLPVIVRAERYVEAHRLRHDGENGPRPPSELRIVRVSAGPRPPRRDTLPRLAGIVLIPVERDGPQTTAASPPPQCFRPQSMAQTIGELERTLLVPPQSQRRHDVRSDAVDITPTAPRGSRTNRTRTRQAGLAATITGQLTSDSRNTSRAVPSSSSTGIAHRQA